MGAALLASHDRALRDERHPERVHDAINVFLQLRLAPTQVDERVLGLTRFRGRCE